MGDSNCWTGEGEVECEGMQMACIYGRRVIERRVYAGGLGDAGNVEFDVCCGVVFWVGVEDCPGLSLDGEGGDGWGVGGRRGGSSVEAG